MTLDPVLLRLFESAPLEVKLPIDWPALRGSAAAMLPLILGTAPPIDVASVEAREIEGPGGSVSLRTYRPNKPTTTTLHYIHGGGWTLGDLETVDHTMRHLCDALPAVVVSSTYRLAPEYPFPAAYDDTFAAAQWVIDHVGELGGDAEQIVIAGDSAGGNLAAAVAIGLRDAALGGKHPLRAQLLLYPAVDLRPDAWQLASRQASADPSLSEVALRVSVDTYVGDHDPSDWRLSPLASYDLSGLPDALVVVVTVDPLRDEGIAYAQRLQQAGSRAEIMEFSNMMHGYTHLRLIVPAAAEATDRVLDRFREILSAS